jgi:Leu/Phe-tRNA-protein transferase
MAASPLRYTSSGFILIEPGDDCDAVVDAMLDTHYCEEFCIAVNLDAAFIARLMRAGFLVMSERLNVYDKQRRDFVMTTILLPKLHLLRSVLFFDDLHVKKSIRRVLPRYELRFDAAFDAITQNCVQTHGDDWLTPALMDAIYEIREDAVSPVQPASFGVYREGRLAAGEFGVVTGRVYTSYSGYHDEGNSGTVQMILAARYLMNAGFAFLDFGMPLDYKTDLGAENISPEDFVRLFRTFR